jgi:hypothetical protein
MDEAQRHFKDAYDLESTVSVQGKYVYFLKAFKD